MANIFIDPLKEFTSYQKLLEKVEKKKSISTYGIIESNIGHFCYALNQHLNRQILILTYDERRAEKIYEDIKNFQRDKIELYPDRDIIFYKIDAISSERTNDRLKILSRLVKDEPIIVVAHIESILNKLMNPTLFKENSTKIDLETTIELDQLISKLIAGGYQRETMVEGVGQFSARGGIIDFYPPNSDNPYRIEMFDDEIDSIRSFDIITQRSLEMVESVYIPPVREVLLLDDLDRKSTRLNSSHTS